MASQYATVWERNIKIVIKPTWTEAWYEMAPRDSHPKMAERGAKYTATKGDAAAAAEAVKLALERRLVNHGEDLSVHAGGSS